MDFAICYGSNITNVNTTSVCVKLTILLTSGDIGFRGFKNLINTQHIACISVSRSYTHGDAYIHQLTEAEEGRRDPA